MVRIKIRDSCLKTERKKSAARCLKRRLDHTMKISQVLTLSRLS